MGFLRDLHVDQQVALLFLTLFGSLALATVGLLVWTIRREEDLRLGPLKRDLGALWVAAVVFWLAWASGALGATLLFGVLSFLALREMITLVHTRRGDHRSLILAFFAILPLQYLLVGLRAFDLFTVFIPVYAFLAIPVASALAGDPHRFLERNAKIQWGIMVCVYGLSHAPALLLLDFPGRHAGRGAFLVFFLVVVASAAQIVQEAASRWLRRRPVARRIDRSFSYRAWTLGALAEIEAGLELDGLSGLAERMRALSARDLTVVLAALSRGGGERELAGELERAPVDAREAAEAVAKAFAAA